jgi:hypothetical protein
MKKVAVLAESFNFPTFFTPIDVWWTLGLSQLGITPLFPFLFILLLYKKKGGKNVNTKGKPGKVK